MIFSKRINRTHLTTPIWEQEPHIVKLWFLLLAIQDNSGFINETHYTIRELSYLSESQYDDALNVLSGKKTKYINAITIDNNGIKIHKQYQSTAPLPVWKVNSQQGFKAYKDMAFDCFVEILNDNEFIEELELSYPNADIHQSIKDSYTNYWGTVDGWKNKKGKKGADIDWRLTIKRTIKFNLVKQ